jgi:hypothetical protein
MLRDLLRLAAHRSSPVGGDTAEAEAMGTTVQHTMPFCTAVPAAAVSVEQASSLITSCARKQAEKRRADSSCQGQVQQVPVKRSRAEDAVAQVQDQDQQEDGSTSDVSIDDQENLQQVTLQYQQLAGAPHHPVVRAACSSLGHMLAPFVSWAPSQGLDAQQLLALEQQGQQLMLEEPACAQEDALAWSDETVACSEEGLNSPSSSSAPAVSQPSTAGTEAGHSLQSLPKPVYVQQQQQAQDAEQDQDTLQAQLATHSVEGTAVTSAGNNTAEDTDDVDYDEDDFDPFTFISGLGPVDRYVAPGRQPLLPRRTRACKQKTLVLDLDETLVHSTLDAGYGAGADFSFPVLFNGCEHMVHVRTRPHMQVSMLALLRGMLALLQRCVRACAPDCLVHLVNCCHSVLRHKRPQAWCAPSLLHCHYIAKRSAR